MGIFHSPRGFSRETLETLRDQLERSIDVRHAELLDLGNRGGHGQRLAQEARFLRQITKALTEW